MSRKKQTAEKINILSEDTELSICLAKPHPNKKMQINGVMIEGYKPKHYTLPKGTDIGAIEVVTWFKINPIAHKEN